MSLFDVTLIRAVDELHADVFITDATWDVLTKHYNETQLMDLVMTEPPFFFSGAQRPYE